MDAAQGLDLRFLGLFGLPLRRQLGLHLPQRVGLGFACLETTLHDGGLSGHGCLELPARRLSPSNVAIRGGDALRKTCPQRVDDHGVEAMALRCRLQQDRWRGSQQRALGAELFHILDELGACLLRLLFLKRPLRQDDEAALLDGFEALSLLLVGHNPCRVLLHFGLRCLGLLLRGLHRLLLLRQGASLLRHGPVRGLDVRLHGRDLGQGRLELCVLALGRGLRLGEASA
mmetsp:Transcript_32523/g.64502  ORF Transcript_32523/g.64502 Transcript_32523/m.64502 type:complete len:230 (+) Transcript_32523:167-856(+)